MDSHHTCALRQRYQTTYGQLHTRDPLYPNTARLEHKPRTKSYLSSGYLPSNRRIPPITPPPQKPYSTTHTPVNITIAHSYCAPSAPFPDRYPPKPPAGAFQPPNQLARLAFLTSSASCTNLRGLGFEPIIIAPDGRVSLSLSPEELWVL